MGGVRVHPKPSCIWDVDGRTLGHERREPFGADVGGFMGLPYSASHLGSVWVVDRAVIREHVGVPLTWCREYPKTSDGAVPKHVGRQLGSHSAKMLEYYKCGPFFNICVHMHL